MNLLQVALGGAIGAALRYLAVQSVARVLGTGFPWGTMFVNVAGSVAMGIIAQILMERMPGSWRLAAPFFITGILGGFTTFSAFSLDAFYLIERGRSLAALAYVSATVVLCIAGLWAGFAFARLAAAP